MACTEACPTGALARIPAIPERVAAEVRIGVPVLDRKTCLPWSGEGVCRLCAYVCPMGSRAVELVGPQQAPLFHPEGCVGCGLCEEACPEEARAIRIAPARRREVGHEPADVAPRPAPCSAHRRRGRRRGGGRHGGARSRGRPPDPGPVPLLPAPLRSRWKGVRDDAPARGRGHRGRDARIPLPARARLALGGPLARAPPPSAGPPGRPAARDLVGRGARVRGRADGAGARALRSRGGGVPDRLAAGAPSTDGVDPPARAGVGDAERRLGGEPLRDGREDGPGAHRGEQVPARPPPDADPRRLGRQPHAQRPAARARGGPEGDRGAAGGRGPGAHRAGRGGDRAPRGAAGDGRGPRPRAHPRARVGGPRGRAARPGADGGVRRALGAGRGLPAAEDCGADRRARRSDSPHRAPHRDRDPDGHLVRPGGGAPRERRPDGAGHRRAGGALPPRGRARDSPGPHPGPPGERDRPPAGPAPVLHSRAGASCAAGPAGGRRRLPALRDVQPGGARQRAGPGHPRGPAVPGTGPGAHRVQRARHRARQPGAPARRGPARAPGLGRPVPHRQRSAGARGAAGGHVRRGRGRGAGAA